MISFRGLMEQWLIIIPNPNPFLQFWKQISIQINKRQSEKAACNVEINFQNKKGPQNGIEDTVTKIKFKNFSISKFEKLLDLEIRQFKIQSLSVDWSKVNGPWGSKWTAKY